MAKMRVSMHNGKGSSKHNDRSFLKNLTDDEIKEKAEHINIEKTKNNFYWATEEADKKFSDGATFEEIEKSYYNKFFSKALDETNQNYIRQGHSERVKSIDDWYKSKQKAPVESILQVGDMNSNIDPRIFKKMCFDYVNYINKKYEQNIKILDFAIHFDETSPHMHLRQVFAYEDKGILKIGQNKALEQLNIALPNPQAKSGRKNNRKMTLDKELRTKWQEIAKSYGYDIETEPRVNMRHKDKEEFIDDQIAKKQDQLEQLDKTIEAVVKNSDSRTSRSFKKRLNILGYSLVPDSELKALKNDFKALESKSNSLETRNKMLQIDSDELKRLKNNPSKLIYEAKKESKHILETARNEAKSIEDSAKMTIHEYAELRNFKAHWNRIKDMFPERIEQLEKDYKINKSGGKQRRQYKQVEFKNNNSNKTDAPDDFTW